jgi:hypothetical protein
MIGSWFARHSPPFARSERENVQHREDWVAAERPRFAKRREQPRRQLSASEHIYFAIRSISADGHSHVLQYAFVDDRGTVVLSAMARSASPVTMIAGQPAEDLSMEPLDPEAFEYLMSRLCGGATLVAFHRVLQGGLLPYLAVTDAASVECAWRRFQTVARRRGIRLSRGEPLTLSDCLEKAGLDPLTSEDAAMRALAIRALWRWMDEAEG